MDILKKHLLDYFKRNKNILTVSYKEIKKEINNSSLNQICENYNAQIYELSFYHSELKKYI